MAAMTGNPADRSRHRPPVRLAALALALLVAGLGLAACSETARVGPRARYENPWMDRTHWTRIEPAMQIARIAQPPRPPVLARQERIIHNTLTQHVVYENDTDLPGENYLRLTAVYDPYRWKGRLTYSDARSKVTFDEQTIAERLDAEFPDLDWQIDSQIEHNLYGVFSFAQARQGREANCIYAWQTVNEDERVLPDSLRGYGLEFRMCDSNLATGQMLDMFSRVAFRLETGVLPLVEPHSPNRALLHGAQKTGPNYRGGLHGRD